MSQTHSPSRRTFLASTAVAAAVVGGVPLLSACSSEGGGGGKGGTTTKKDAAKLLPTYRASRVVEPDIPSENGSRPGFTGKAEPYAQLPASVPEKLGKGGKVTIMSPLWGTPPKKDCAYYRAVDEATGVTVDWQTQDGNTYGEKLGAVLASSGIPDMVVIPSWEMQGKIPSAIDSRFADLGSYLSGDNVEKYPNLAAIPTEAWRMSIFSGKLKGLPLPSGAVDIVIPYYRQDIFEDKGWEVPTSAQGFMDLAKEITAPRAKVWACEDMKWTAFNVFGALPDKPYCWEWQGEKLVHRIETDNYLEALEWTRKLYAAGVVHPDAMAVRGDAGTRFTAGQSMMTNDGNAKWYGWTFEQREQNPDFRVSGMDIFGHDGGDPRLYFANPAGIWAFVNRKASKETVEECLAIANFAAAPYGTRENRLVRYGVEGTHYTLEDGVPTKTPQGVTETQDTYFFTAGSEAVAAFPDYPQIVRDWCAWQQRMGAFMKKPLLYGMQVREPNRWANLGDQFEDLEDDVVRGRKKISDMQRAIEDWRKAGGDELRDWYRKLIDEVGESAA
ncbi:extracellular solute-binding protein [Streptomyces sp. TRM43335]|uniref:Extracellular solute-binding protein n=1 Tax=Streptomyces taklimakanensis TaxID=2569853 RepID=A0A6G2BG44_9ACTN|nr:extracellular solute-binding protein [Streptomyces taklimakanensis]MTE21238.1 extracellular solute-binding protein [Streptomyces taklimakanensis]